MIGGGGQARRRGVVYIFGTGSAAWHGQRCSLSLTTSKFHSESFLKTGIFGRHPKRAGGECNGDWRQSFFLRGETAELVGEQAASDVPERKNEKGVDKERKVCYNRIRGLGVGLRRAKRMTSRRTKNYVIIYYVGVNGK